MRIAPCTHHDKTDCPHSQTVDAHAVAFVAFAALTLIVAFFQSVNRS